MTHAPQRGWHLERHPDAAECVRQRAAALAALRGALADDGFIEADVPSLAPTAGQDAHLSPPRVQVDGFEAPLYLQTSPELALKRLVMAGVSRVFSLAPAYRGGREELSPQHQPAFTMLEWYRPGQALEDLTDDVLRWSTRVAEALGVPPRNKSQSLTVHDAVLRWAGISIEPLLDGDTGHFAHEAQRAGLDRCSDSDDAVTLLSRVLVERVEPALRKESGWTFLSGYPACMSALARLDDCDPRICQRVEAYLDGVEIANGYVELADADEHRRRWEIEREEQASPPPIDELFLAELSEIGLPPCVGMALGFDRLIAQLVGAKEIADVLPLRLRWTT